MENHKLFVGGLAWGKEDNDLKTLFEEGTDENEKIAEGLGTVVSAEVVRDRESNRSRGFGFVVVETAELAATAIQRFNGIQFAGRELKVDNAAQGQSRSSSRSSFGGGSSRGPSPFRGSRNSGSFNRDGDRRRRDY